MPKYGPLLISTETTRTANNLTLLREAGKKRRRRRIGGKGEEGEGEGSLDGGLFFV